MKKNAISALLCVIFVFIISSMPSAYALNDEILTFIYHDRVFEYSLNDNIKSSQQFDLNYELNKYNRFGSRLDRQNLLSKMLDAGFDYEVCAEYLFPNIKLLVNKMERNVNIKPQDAQIKINTNSETVFKVSNEVVGYTLNKTKLYAGICNNFLNKKEMTFVLPVKKIDPEIYAEEFKKYTILRGDFSTDISHSSADRKHNVKNALKALNLIEIAPNQVFSFNKTVGRRTEDNGYRNAKIIVNDEFVDGLGGGVCQVSTTLYNTALLSGLEIVEANKHSKQVSYVKYGFDAMVNYGSSDLKFKNNTGEKIIIVTNYSPLKIRIRIFGESKGNVEYKLTNEIVSVTEPEIEYLEDKDGEYADKVQFEDEYFVLKKGVKGMEIKTYREKYVDGELADKKLLRHDKFKEQNEVQIYGTKKRTEI